jgi:hypothetical protein
MKNCGIFFTGEFSVMTAQESMNTSVNDIVKLIDCLNSLYEGDLAADLLVACGKDAIPHLRKYLMEGQPSHIYQPRQQAVNALTRLGARDVLIEYLCSPKEIPDPAFRFGEEAVENTAARALTRWQTNDVFEVLLRIAQTRTLSGIIEALGSFRRPAAVPLFINALMDDVSRTAAENALKSMGKMAKPALMEATITPASSENYESPSILLRRSSAIRILAGMTVTTEDWSQLKRLLYDDDPEITISASRIAMDVPDCKDKSMVVRAMIEKIPSINWYVQTEIENCLIKHYDVAQKEIADQIAQRKLPSEKAQASDPVLQILIGVRNRAKRSSANAD